MMTNEEILKAFQRRFPYHQVTIRRIRHIIDTFNLEKFCIPPKTDRPWELVKANKVQCAICGRWLRFVNPSHLKKHGLSQTEYKKKFGIMLKQHLCTDKLSKHWKKLAEVRGLGSGGVKGFPQDIKYPTVTKKPLQEMVYRKERGLQAKAGKGLKPRKETQVLKENRAFIVMLREKEKLPFLTICKKIKEEFGVNASVTSVSRIYYGTRGPYGTKHAKPN